MMGNRSVFALKPVLNKQEKFIKKAAGQNYNQTNGIVRKLSLDHGQSIACMHYEYGKKKVLRKIYSRNEVERMSEKN